MGDLNYLWYKYTSFMFKNKELIPGIHDCGINIRNLYTSPDAAGV